MLLTHLTQLLLRLLLHLLVDGGDGGLFGLARAEFLLEDPESVEEVGFEGQLPLRVLPVQVALPGEGLFFKEGLLRGEGPLVLKLQLGRLLGHLGP